MTLEKDYTNLSEVPLDKLYKLRDKATDYMADKYKEYQDGVSRYQDIQLEIIRKTECGENKQ